MVKLYVPLLATLASFATAGDGGDGGYSKTTEVAPPPKQEAPPPKVETKTEWSPPVTTTETIHYPPITLTTTEHDSYPVTIPITLTTTEYDSYPVSINVPTTEYDSYAVYVTVTETLTSVSLNNIPPPPAVTVTSVTVSETELTVFITSTSVPAPVSITTTETDVVTSAVTTPYCEFCKIDIQATELVFPYIVVTTTLYATTLDIYTTISGPNETVYSTSTITNDLSCTGQPLTTWTWSGVVLTSGTTYVGYENYTHATLEQRSSLYGCGELVSSTLDLGPSSTEFAARVVTTAAVTSTIVPAPLEIDYFLDSIPTVVAQLDGVPAISCDDPIATISTAPPPTETATSTEGSDEILRRNLPPTYNAIDALLGLIPASTAAA